MCLKLWIYYYELQRVHSLFHIMKFLNKMFMMVDQNKFWIWSELIITRESQKKLKKKCFREMLIDPLDLRRARINNVLMYNFGIHNKKIIKLRRNYGASLWEVLLRLSRFTETQKEERGGGGNPREFPKEKRCHGTSARSVFRLDACRINYSHYARAYADTAGTKGAVRRGSLCADCKRVLLMCRWWV